MREGWGFFLPRRALVVRNLMKQLYLACTLVLSTFASAQQSSVDTLKLYPMGEVVVTATRNPIPVADAPSPVERLSREQIANTNGTLVTDVIARTSALFLRDLGVNGSLKTISLRGTASEHVLVLLNGIRFNYFQNGLVDFSLMPVNNVERIEIAHGGSSALYGADALGGVINIITRQPREAFRLSTEGSVGSFSYGRYSLEGEGLVGRARLAAGYSQERGRDDYPFGLEGVGTVHRVNADFLRRQIYASTEVPLNPSATLSTMIQRVTAERGAPGPMPFPSDARQDDEDISGSIRYSNHSLEGLDIEVNGGLHYNLEHYLDPYFSSAYRSLHYSINPQARVRVSSVQLATIGAEFVQGSLTGSDFDARIVRVQKAIYALSEVRFQTDRATFDRLIVYPSIRYDHISDVENALTPKIGVNVRVLREGDIRLRASVGRNFRSPSFNDLYYRAFSNPDLHSEHSTSLDAGSVLSARTGDAIHTIEASYYHINTTNRILFDLSTYTPVNIGKVISRGIALRYNSDYANGLVQLGMNYSVGESLDRTAPESISFNKQIPNVPKHLANGSLTLRLDPFLLTVAERFVGRRFTNGREDRWLPAAWLTDANVRVNVPVGAFHVNAKVEVNNVFDRSYVLVQDYPMPGRSVRLTIGSAF
jgi:vitamin B12 transporter